MRVMVSFLLSVMMTGAATASSFLVVPAPEGKATASVVIVTPPPAVSFETAASVDGDPPQGIEPTVTLSYPFVEGEPPRDLAIVAPAGVLREISPSIMAMEVPPEERVAAAGDARGPFSQPVVIRGGIVGDAFATPEAQPEEPQVASDAERPEPAAEPEAPSHPEPVAPPSPSPAVPAPAPE